MHIYSPGIVSLSETNLSCKLWELNLDKELKVSLSIELYQSMCVRVGFILVKF